MTKIAILCGGKGTRMRPLTETIPKPLIPVHGKPILEHIINAYVAQRCRDFVFCVGYKGGEIADFVRRRKGIRASISDRGENASMLERVYALRDKFDGDLFVTYGDTYTDVRVKDILASHRASGKWVTILTARIRSPFGLIKFDERGAPRSFQEKPVLNYYIGQFAINRKAFDSISRNMLAMKDGDGLISLFNHLIDANQLNAYRHEKLTLTFNTDRERSDVESRLRDFYSYNEQK